ncbi:Putative 1,2-phenylacetyl-CoA epoxidase, subunit D [Ruegeria sp. THAF57]|uniref:1,2-phenylacetyl-CoA epoxidase subunit PaaD n=1 Tax=Ruegeria sp. THAF57 TaxID=2744555 RepID=UPI0015E01696|nr:1,2-phenylacetyl-CoA epoxidase subunit PaaD [Ruegeria sp. THAF57]CAD0187021.1 Putative 1,2-phenylacetyl-CoA epoxidase, subunit D [Ruegeria sp. THAF57]
MPVTEAQIWNWLEGVPDPEIPVISVVDLGVIRDVSVSGNAATVTVTPTYSGCPAMAVIAMDIETALAANGVENLQIQTRIAPPWTTDWLSEKARSRLEEFGIAPPQPAGGPTRCPHCKSDQLEKISQFGSTPCKAQWRCQSCLEPFDYFKCI